MDKYKVGIFGHYGNNNLGDEAIISAAIQNLQLRITEVELVGFSLKPLDTQERHNIESYPIRFNSNQSNRKESDDNKSDLNKKNSDSAGLRGKLRKLLRRFVKKTSATFGLIYLVSNLKKEYKFLQESKDILKRLDAIIFTGSNQFLDNFGGPWGFPYTLMKWVLLAKSANTKVFFASVGAGPLTHPLSYWMLKRALKRADYLSYRDEGSKELVEDKISGINGSVYPDIAHSLKTVSNNGGSNVSAKIVAINPMPVFDRRYWYESKPEKYNNYIHSLTELIKHLINLGYEVNLFNHHPKDLLVIDDIIEELQISDHKNTAKVKVIHNKTIQDLIDTISAADIIVGTRFHSIVLPIRLNKPILGICYHRKSIELLEDIGLGSYSVDIHKISDKELVGKFNSMVENIETIEGKITVNYKRYDSLMNEQWDHLTEMICQND